MTCTMQITQGKSYRFLWDAKPDIFFFQNCDYPERCIIARLLTISVNRICTLFFPPSLTLFTFSFINSTGCLLLNRLRSARISCKHMDLILQNWTKKWLSPLNFPPVSGCKSCVLLNPKPVNSKFAVKLPKPFSIFHKNIWFFFTWRWHY
jgi:hypothetical protein